MSLQPLVIEAAINGATPKALSPHVPRTPDEIVADACACLAAGAALVHHHNDEGLMQARHASAPYAAVWERVLERHPDALLYPTMGSGGAHTNIHERYAHVEELADAGLLRMALIDPGSVSLGGLDAQGLPAPVDLVYQNSFADARYMIDGCRARGLAAHISIFEPGFLRVALAYHAAGRLPPAKIQFYFGGPALPFGLPATSASLDAYLAMLEGTQLPWMVGVIGGDVAATPLAELAIRRGGHVRVGLEDYTGPRRPRNLELVEEIVALATRFGRPVATSAEASLLFGVPSLARRGARPSVKLASVVPAIGARWRDAMLIDALLPLLGSWRDRVVLVTGASSGIGRETALLFGRLGARVALVARRQALLESVAAELQTAGGEALVVPADVGDANAARAAVARVRATWDRIDLLVNNAGLLRPAPVARIETTDLDAMLRVNLYGALFMTQAALPILLRHPGGSIVNVASLAGRRGLTPLGGYCATKFALIGLSEALRTEFAAETLHVGVVLPGVVETPMVQGVDQAGEIPEWPVELNMPAEWVAAAIALAARFRLREVSVPPGAALLEELGALVPGISDLLIGWMSAAGRWLARAEGFRPDGRPRS